MSLNINGNSIFLVKTNMTEYILLAMTEILTCCGCVRDMTIGRSRGLSSKACLVAADVIYGCFPIPSSAGVLNT